MPAPGGERAALSRDLADFLIELSIALHKHAMYPEGHPSLAPAAAGVTRRAGLLLEDRATLSLGVARQQLVIEGVATDPKHPVLAELAARLHRHHLGAVTFRRGVEPGEMATVLKTLAVDAERTGQPLGLGPPERLRAWTCVQLHPLTYERLELVDDGAPASERGARAAQLWVGLARAALTAQAGDSAPTPTEPAVIARAIDEHPRSDAAAYDQVIVGYLLQIADELKAAGSAEAVALRRRTSRLIRALKPETLRRLVEMGGDFMQRRQFVYDSTDGMAVDAVLDIVQAAAESSHQTISHSLVRMLSKLAAHAETGVAAVRPQADAALRDQVRQLLQGWTLQDPNPGQYGAALERMARAAPARATTADGEHASEPDRLVAMALEIDAVNAHVLAAADRVVREGRLGQLLDALAEVPESQGAAPEVWARLATADVVRQLATHDPVDFKTLERLVPRVGIPAAAPRWRAAPSIVTCRPTCGRSPSAPSATPGRRRRSRRCCGWPRRVAPCSDGRSCRPSPRSSLPRWRGWRAGGTTNRGCGRCCVGPRRRTTRTSGPRPTQTSGEAGCERARRLPLRVRARARGDDALRRGAPGARARDRRRLSAAARPPVRRAQRAVHVSGRRDRVRAPPRP